MLRSIGVVNGWAAHDFEPNSSPTLLYKMTVFRHLVGIVIVAFVLVTVCQAETYVVAIAEHTALNGSFIIRLPLHRA